MILGLVLMIAANGAAALGAAALTRRFGTGRAAPDATLFLLFRLLLVSAAVVLAGLTQTLTRWGLGLAGAAALAGLLAARAHRDLPRVAWREAGAPALVVAAAVAARLLAQVWLFAPHLGDAAAYHLPKVAEWVRAGGFTREMGLHPHATFPAGFELVEAWWVVFLRHDALIELAGAEFLLLGSVAVVALARHAGLGRRPASFAGLVYALTPGLHLSATSGLNDAAAAALVVATFALAAARAPWPLLLMAAGLGAGVKPTYGFALTGVALLAFLLRREPAAPAGRGALVPAAAACLLGALWYGRNVLWYGNPFYPLGSPEVENPVAVQLGPSVASFLRNVGHLLTMRLYDRGPYGANVDHIAGWGAPVFAAGLPGLLVGVMQDARLRRLAAGFGLSLATVLLFVQDDPWCLKYAFFFPAILAVAAARLAEAARPVLVLAAAGLGLSFLGTMLPYDLPARDVIVLARQRWRERSALVLSEPPVPDPDVACLGGYRARSYLLYGPDFARRVVYLRPGPGSDPAEDMRRAGVRSLYAWPETAVQASALDRALRSGALERVGGHLYRLRRQE